MRCSLALLALANLVARSNTHRAVHHSSGFSLQRRADSCPAGSGSTIASFWPAWLSSVQKPDGSSTGFPWSKNNLAFYFVLVSTADGIAVPAGQSTSEIKAFVSTAHKKGRKAVFTIGGWSGSVYFSDHISVNTAKRTAFAQKIEAFRSTYNFDGVDIDWEFIGRQGAGSNHVRTKDAAGLLQFLPILRKTLPTGSIISASLPASGITGADGKSLTNTAAYGKYFDYITVMAYDMYASAWSATTGPNAPLWQCNANSGSVQGSIKQWLDSGFPACRILLGVPGYSHIFKTKTNKIATTTFNGSKATSFQALDPVQRSDPTTTFKGLIAAGWLSADGKTGLGGYTRYWDACTKTPFLFDPSTRSFISYDDASSIGAKSLFARSMKLAGLAFYDSTGPTGPLYDAGIKGLAGKWPTTAA